MGAVGQQGASGISSFLDVPMSHTYYTGGPNSVAEGYANNDPVDNFPDEHGGVDAVQATGANQPLWITALAEMGGLNVIRGNGAAHHLRTADYTDSAQPHTVLCVGRRRISKNDGAFMDGKQASTKHALAVIDSRNLHLDGGDSASITAAVNVTGEAPWVLEAVFDGATSEAYMGGRLVWTGTLAADMSEGITFFDSAEISGGSKSLLGEICYGAIRLDDINGGRLTALERANFVALAAQIAGTDDLTTGLAVYPDRFSRPAQEADGSLNATVSPDPGDKLVVQFVADSVESTHVVTDNDDPLGLDWNKEIGVDQGARGASIWTKVATGAETTVTMAAGAAFVHGQVEELAGGGTTDSVNSGADAGANTTTVTPSVTTTDTDTAIFFVVLLSGTSAETSWTNAFHANVGVTSRLHTARKVVKTAGAHSSVFTWATLRRAVWAAVAISAA